MSKNLRRTAVALAAFSLVGIAAACSDNLASRYPICFQINLPQPLDAWFADSANKWNEAAASTVIRLSPACAHMAYIGATIARTNNFNETWYMLAEYNEDGNGNIVFSSGQRWYPFYYYDLKLVALHELGHALGLPHTNEDSVMRSGYEFRFAQLTEYDVAAIKALLNGTD